MIYFGILNRISPWNRTKNEQKKNGEIMNHQNWFLFKNRRKKMQPFINKFFLTGSEYHFTVE